LNIALQRSGTILELDQRRRVSPRGRGERSHISLRFTRVAANFPSIAGPIQDGPCAALLEVIASTETARAAIVLSVLVSSPSDVEAARATVLTAIHDWNNSYSRDLGIILEPIQWQTHAYPESGDRPQALINKQIVDESDMVVAVFGYRIGTATGVAQSGTIEEIERLRAKGKHVAVYFSTAPIPHDHDPEQLRRLNEYRESLKPSTLYWTFESTEDLYRKSSQHLARSVSRLYQELRVSKTIGALASQLPGVVSGPELTSGAEPETESPAEPFRMQHVAVGDPPQQKLRLTGNQTFSLVGLDYVEENGARFASDSNSTVHSSQMVEGKGEMLEIPIDHAKLVQIHNLKPRAGDAGIPMQFRVHMVVDGREQTRTIPALLQPSFKQIGGGRHRLPWGIPAVHGTVGRLSPHRHCP
jgi:hypothetical protein